MAWPSRFWWIPFGSVPEISPNELHATLSGNAPPYVLDVRTHREWKASRIEGAVNIPITSFRTDLKNLSLEPARPVIAICLSAHRSIPAVRALRAAGFINAYQLQGGMLAWWKAELPVVKGV
jgi:rhodanese-related sulfurtransferase